MGLGNMQRSSLEQVSKNNDEKLERVRAVVENRLQLMQKDNNEKLEVMRATVDEKLHATLEKRLGESFKLVSDRLESVHKGLGEMQTLAAGVGDLKKVLTNVKTRGTWGEVQLGSLLDQIMTPAQYEKNVAVKKRSGERVEFAIKLPNGPDEETPLWLPIDAKFPVEDYQRLVAAREVGDLALIESVSKDLVTRIKGEAKDIRDKYIAPPETTDFGILYLPTEGLYAEITQRPGLQELLQRDYRVMVAGPNTVAALLNSLQMGFRTLAIEKRSSEVWQILGSVKNEFGKFGDLLDKTHKKLQEASNTIESAASKSRTIERKLDKVQDLPTSVPVEPAKLVGAVMDEKDE
jgi:DNA recombination protein RmuC